MGECFPGVRRRFHTFHAPSTPSALCERLGGERVMPQRRVISGRSQEPRQRFAEELRRLRAERRVSLRQLGERVGWDWSLFGKMEKGETISSPEVVRALDTFYGTPDFLMTLWELATGDKSQFKERYRRYMKLEAEAVALWHFAVSVVPGLLQTPGYAREVLAAGGYKGKELDQQVEARTSRKVLLEGEDAPPFRTILAEAVLRTPAQDEREWHAQLEYLLEASERQNITVQVLLQSAGVHGLVGTEVWFLRLADGRPVAYTENAYSGELIEESTRIERKQRAYDVVRDMALSPAESRKFILRMLEEVPCDPST